ncbi:MAG: histidine ammonia-lyase [Bacteroidia bacterium]|nr:histidine ammonia-lyase [Bacteroidia bacterium]
MFYIDNAALSLDTLTHFFESGEKAFLSEDAVAKIEKCRAYLDTHFSGSSRIVYGINTGFGALCDTVVESYHLETLQYNLIRSHACGMGEEVPEEVVRMMLLTKVRSLAFGYSGVQLITAQRLLDFYNENITPVVFTQGSLGASGDLSPLAHLCLPLIGEGEVRWRGQVYPSSVVLEKLGWEPVKLKSKEGLALLNGTQFMLSYGLITVARAEKAWHLSNLIAAISIDAFHAKLEPFNPLIHQIRPHAGQIKTAETILTLLQDSEIAHSAKKQVQDPYSFRCIPQVHGASYDVIQYAKGIFQIEFNSATDNPNVFPDEDCSLSGGNFHGQPLALTLDFLAIAMAELASISERRTFQLISGSRGLPAFLTSNPGLSSGFMIPQYTAAGIVSQNKQLCTPASVDSIPSSHNQEDHVSMGANAATKCYKVSENTFSVLGIECMNASQAISFREPLKTGTKVQHFIDAFRKEVPVLNEDMIMYNFLNKAGAFLKFHVVS